MLRDMLYALGATVTAPYWVWRMLRTGKWRTDWRGRFGHVQRAAHEVSGMQGAAHAVSGPAKPCEAASGGDVCEGVSRERGSSGTILIHAVSVGEVNATRQLVDKLAASVDGVVPRIVISTTTDTGFARATELFGRQHTVVRFPLDFTRCVRRFLDAVKPDVVALVELEVWPTFVEECDKRGIPVCVINGRLSARSFKRYKLIRSLIHSSFVKLRAVAVQTPDYAERFIALGAAKERVSVTDSMKWDTAKVEEPAAVTGAAELAAAMGIDLGKPLIVAGSTGPGEEEMLIRTKPAGVQLLIAPRKPERFEEVAKLLEQSRHREGAVASASSVLSEQPLADARGSDKAVVRRTRHRDGNTRSIDGTEIFLLDTLGELRKAYALADVVIVGRSFINLYGSDPIEPIALGKPTIIGPRYGDFEDIVNAFRAEAGICVSAHPCAAAVELLENHEQARVLAEIGRKVILARQGATDRHVKLIREMLDERRCSYSPPS